MSDKIEVKFKVTAPDSMKYWLAIDENDLVVNQGEAKVNLGLYSR